MPTYRMEVLLPGEQRFVTRDLIAADKADALAQAHKQYAIISGPGLALDRFVLYEGDRVLDEHVGPPQPQSP